MAGEPNYSQEVIDKLQAGLEQVGKDHPDLQNSTTGGVLSKKAFEGIDVLQSKMVAVEQNVVLSYVSEVAKQFTTEGQDPKVAMADAMKKINAMSKAAKGGRLVVGPGVVDYATELSNKQAYQIMATLLEKFDQLKTNANSADFEGDLNKTDMAKGSRNDRLALAIASLVQSAHKILTKDPGYSQFINSGANGPLIHDIVTKIKNKDAPVITIEGSVAAPQATAPKGPPPIPQAAEPKGPPPIPQAAEPKGPPPIPQAVAPKGPPPIPQAVAPKGPPPIPQAVAPKGPPPIPQAAEPKGPPPIPQATAAKGPPPIPQAAAPKGPPPIPQAAAAGGPPPIPKAAVPPPLPGGYSNKSAPPPLPMFQHKEGSPKTAAPEVDKKGPTPPPLPPGFKR
jgi:hypothetical protein